ncbi:OmpA family protein [Bacillus sp. FJAT-29814]|uniref:OmpA family protein n=1 Tax=Bacillus sp. FJAT-29814 TaxID=1729688 RepID=UPI00082C0D20|nr:OmpA family protein [Bacillus sp. FJAT-29814]
MKRKYNRLLNHNSEESDFWPSFTDLLSSILLVVLIVFVGIIVTINNESKARQEKSQEEINKQAKLIAEKEKQIEALSYIQKDIVENLERELSDKQLGISIDKETGAIKFKDDLLFETGKDVIRPEFKEKLHQFLRIYFSTLYGQYKDQIAEVVVEGHTDDVGDYIDNLDLSQRRASSVVKFILSDGDIPFKDLVTKDITANGRSESQLKIVNGVVDRAQSRRVEFKFRLKNNYEGSETKSGN